MGIEWFMHMAVDQKSGLLFVYQPVKAFKTPMAEVFGVMNMPGRGMGDQDINPALSPDGKPQALDNFFCPVSLRNFSIRAMAEGAVCDG